MRPEFERGKRLESLSQKLLKVLNDEVKSGSLGDDDVTFAMQALVATTFIVMTKACPHVKSQDDFMEVYMDNVREIIKLMTPLSAN